MYNQLLKLIFTLSIIFRRIEQRDAERRIKLLNEENSNMLKKKKEKQQFYDKYLRKEIPGEEFTQKVRNPNYVPESQQCPQRISKEEIDTKFRNYERKEVRSSLTIDSEKSER